jgi:hypothetical protein
MVTVEAHGRAAGLPQCPVAVGASSSALIAGVFPLFARCTLLVEVHTNTAPSSPSPRSVPHRHFELRVPLHFHV